MSAFADSAVRRRVRGVARKLETLYGTPRRGTSGSVLDSLVGCILSQNTNDLNSGRAWRSLKKRFPDWDRAAAAPAKDLEDAIRVGGLAPSKSARIRGVLSFLSATTGEYSLEFLRGMSDEEIFEYLTAMDGVGAKTAAVVLLFALGRDVFPVDTHVHRICRRLGFANDGATRDAVFEAMKTLVPPGRAFSLHINLIRFGKERCCKRQPVCEGCPFRRSCLYVKGEMTS